jgi:Protein of unknown function (DUF1302)
MRVTNQATAGKGRRARSWMALGAVASAMSAPAYSFDFTLTDDIKGSLITLITGGLSQRLREQNAELVAAPGTNGFLTGFQDAHLGDLNYNRGDLFALYVKGSHELLLKFPDKYKFFARTGWIFDGKAGDTEFVPLANQAHTQAAHDLRLYDLWVSKDFELFGRSARARLGRQTINWGESLFIAGGINATAAIDLYRLTYPGVPLKEVVLPAEMASVAFSPAKGVNVESYYQFDWNPNRLVPVGTFFSTSDYIGQGQGTNWFFTYDPRYAATHGGVQAYNPATGGPTGPIITNPQQALALAQANNFTFCAVAAIVGNTCSTGNFSLNFGSPIIAPDQTPTYGGQFGISAHYKPEGTAVDFGLYIERFHEKQPLLKYVVNPSLPLGYGQELVYPQGHFLYGVSGNVLVGQWAVGSEISYRPKDPILVDPFSCSDPVIGGGGANCHGNFASYRDAHKWQWNTTWWRAVNPSDQDWYAWLVRHAGAQQANIQGEFALIHYPGVSNHSYQGLGLLSDLSYDIQGFGGQGVDHNARHFGTANSFGFVQYLDMTFDGTVIPGWQVIPNVTWSVGVAGDTPNSNYTWFQGVISTTYAVTLTQNLQKWSGALLYVTYRGGDPSILRNFYADRDWWGAQVTYTF